jgi:hypothetical protein
MSWKWKYVYKEHWDCGLNPNLNMDMCLYRHVEIEILCGPAAFQAILPNV